MHRFPFPQGTGHLEAKEPNMGTTTSIESQRALAWIVRQLSWERTLEQLRAQADEPTSEKVAA